MTQHDQRIIQNQYGFLPAPTPNDLVKEFHETYGLAIRDIPQLEVPEREMRKKLIQEEYEEFMEAYENDDFIEMSDAVADLIYVLYGWALTHGVPLDEILAEVQASNMSKLDENGEPIYREDGKVLKGPNFFVPNIRQVLINNGWQPKESE